MSSVQDMRMCCVLLVMIGCLVHRVCTSVTRDVGVCPGPETIEYACVLLVLMGCVIPCCLYFSDKEMLVRVQGPRPENVLFLIHEVIESLVVESFSGVSYDFLIPCPDCIKKTRVSGAHVQLKLNFMVLTHLDFKAAVHLDCLNNIM